MAKEQTSNETTITLTANSYLDTILTSMFELVKYGIKDEIQLFTMLEQMFIENFRRNHEMRELFNETKTFALKLNKLPPENRPIVEGTLKYAIARWNQLETRLRKEPGLAKQFTYKFD